MTSFQDALLGAHRTLASVNGSSVTYDRNGTEIELTAVQGATKFHVTDASGVVIELESKDFILERADLLVGSVPFLPSKGDTITVDTDDVLWSYEVARPDGGQDIFHIPDADRRLIRIHTILVQQDISEVGGAFAIGFDTRFDRVDI